MRAIMSVIKPVFIIVILAFTAGDANAQTYSDTDLKTNIRPIDNPLNTIRQLEPKAFEYNTGKFNYLKLPQGVQYGFLAEDVEKAVPGVVTYSRVSYMRGKNLYRTATVPSVDNEKLIPLLIASVREQQFAIDQLRTEVLELRKMLQEKGAK